MSGQKAKILSDLKTVSLIKPGQTLSMKDMSIVDHTSWAGALSRFRNREDHTKTISGIESIFEATLTLLKTVFDVEVSQSLEAALKGFENMKETYKGKYYIIGDINRITESTRGSLVEIVAASQAVKLTTESSNSKPQQAELETADIMNELITGLEELIDDPELEAASIVNELITELADLVMEPQKICPCEDTTSRDRSPSSSNSKPMVSTSDRANSAKAVASTVDKSSPKRDRKDNIGPTISVDDSERVKRLVNEASNNTTQIVLSASAAVSKSMNQPINEVSVTDSAKETPTLSKSLERDSQETDPKILGEMTQSETNVSEANCSEKVIKNIATSKDTSKYVSRSTEPISSNSTIIATELAESTVNSARPSILTDSETDSSSSDCGTSFILRACINLSRRDSRTDHVDRPSIPLSKCPAFSTGTTGSSETIDGTPPIFGLAKSFRNWIESLGTDSDSSEDESSESGTLTL